MPLMNDTEDGRGTLVQGCKELSDFDYFWPKKANLMVYFENLSYNPRGFSIFELFGFVYFVLKNSVI